jgi:hypothetical protein
MDVETVHWSRLGEINSATFAIDENVVWKRISIAVALHRDVLILRANSPRAKICALTPRNV